MCSLLLMLHPGQWAAAAEVWILRVLCKRPGASPPKVADGAPSASSSAFLFKDVDAVICAAAFLAISSAAATAGEISGASLML